MTIDRKEEIITAYKEILASKKDLPVYADLSKKGITRETVRHHFDGIQKLQSHIFETEPDFVALYLYSVENIFDQTRSVSNSKKSRFIVTTAVSGTKAHLGFISAMRSYAKKHDAQIAIMPCESVTNSFENRTAVFDPVFLDKDFLFVQEDTKLNDNITLCSIQVSAKQVKPITGLTRLGQREGSYVFAAPKQFLEYVPSGHGLGKTYAIMTPGACTLPDYYSETFVSKRLSYIASQDHTIGAVLIELDGDRLFHFRQIQAADDGSFIDFGIQYNPDGTQEHVSANVILGDLHGVYCDRDVLNCALESIQHLEIEKLYLHDTFDGKSISHHIVDIGKKTSRTMSARDNLYRELEETYELVRDIEESLEPHEVILVKSNHDEVLDRYLSEGRYIYDPENHYTALKIAPALFEEKDLLQAAFEFVAQEPMKKNWKFLDRRSTSKIAGVECGAHGDLGINGGAASMTSMEKVYGNCVIGHSHTAAIQRGVFRVGTMSCLEMGYNRGPSSWTHTFCLLYNNGQRQLINIVSDRVSS